MPVDSFLEDDLHYSKMEYPIVRSYYIEEKLLRPWCNTHAKSQIVLLGAGLDTRAYRFKPFQTNRHTVFEIDFPIVIDYKKKMMQKEKPLCTVIRLSADLVDPNWSSRLIKNGFSKDILTFWVLEGLAYYIERVVFSSLLKKTAEITKEGSQLFIDIIHASSTNSTHPSSKRQKWGMSIREVPNFFATSGWEVTSSFADENNQSQNDGQKRMVFIQGVKK
ncbi:MAG: class I SAM-dependent methyltransferase [Promethearchaeota archaeon]|jgi:methyltransferase (TIGR00027 family)